MQNLNFYKGFSILVSETYTTTASTSGFAVYSEKIDGKETKDLISLESIIGRVFPLEKSKQEGTLKDLPSVSGIYSTPNSLVNSKGVTVYIQRGKSKQVAVLENKQLKKHDLSTVDTDIDEKRELVAVVAFTDSVMVSIMSYVLKDSKFTDSMIDSLDLGLPQPKEFFKKTSEKVKNMTLGSSFSFDYDESLSVQKGEDDKSVLFLKKETESLAIKLLPYDKPLGDILLELTKNVSQIKRSHKGLDNSKKTKFDIYEGSTEMFGIILQISIFVAVNGDNVLIASVVSQEYLDSFDAIINSISIDKKETSTYPFLYKNENSSFIFYSLDKPGERPNMPLSMFEMNYEGQITKEEMIERVKSQFSKLIETEDYIYGYNVNKIEDRGVTVQNLNIILNDRLINVYYGSKDVVFCQMTEVIEKSQFKVGDKLFNLSLYIHE